MGSNTRRAWGWVVALFLLVAVAEGGILPALRFFLGLLVLGLLMCGLVYLLVPDEGSAPASSRPLARLEAVADFTSTVSQLEAALTRRAHSEALAGITELDAILARYKARGQLSPELEADLEAFMVRNTVAFASLSDDVGRALDALIRAYAPPPTRLRYWWRTKALSRFRG